jgi:hypothetical protein
LPAQIEHGGNLADEIEREALFERRPFWRFVLISRGTVRY